MSYTSEVREHSANITQNIALPHAELDIDYKAEDIRVKFTYCWGLWMFVCACGRENEKQLTKIRREVFCYRERHWTTNLQEKTEPMTWSDALFGSIWEYLCTRNTVKPKKSLQVEQMGSHQWHKEGK